MASGNTHTRITGLLIVPSAVAGALLGGVEPAALMAAGCACGWFIEPDLDVDGLTRSEWRIVKRLHFVGMLWVTLWYPYARAIPHRSPLSHWPVLGTALRCLYLLAWLWLLQRIVDSIQLDLMALVNSQRVHYWFIGLCIADAAHWLADVISTAYKVRFKRWQKS